jgi:hypothetical protein
VKGEREEGGEGEEGREETSTVRKERGRAVKQNEIRDLHGEKGGMEEYRWRWLERGIRTAGSKTQGAACMGEDVCQAGKPSENG